MKCTQCNERNGNTRCAGCDTLFCLPCLTKHHDELAQQFESLMNIRNEIKHSLINNRSDLTNIKQITCLNQIDEWERESIQRIQQIATKIRTNVNELRMKYINEISHRFEKLSIKMQEQQKEGNYLENDIESVKTQLKQVKNDIEQINEKIKIDTTISKNIQWERLIYVVENDLLNNGASKSMKIKDKLTSDKTKSTIFDKYPNKENVHNISSNNSRTQQVESKTTSLNIIPVQIVPSELPSNKKTNQVQTCLFCQRPCHDSPSMDVCTDCHKNLRISNENSNINVRSHLSYIPIQTNTRDHTNPSSLKLNPKKLSIRCQQCKHQNLLDSSNNFELHCAICHSRLSTVSDQ